MASAAKSTGNPEQGIDTKELLPLDLPELIAWVVVDEKVFCHVFRRITQADWKVYFTSGVDDSVRAGDLRANGLALYRRVILRAEGYRSGDGRRPEDLASWPECIPQEHRLTAIDLLLKTFFTFAVESFAYDENTGQVSLGILSSDGRPGPICCYFRVVHHFHPPTAKQHKRFLMARAFHADKGESAFGTLLSLYDELIERVQGYSVAGRELRGKEEIAGNMDAFHKAIAVGILFESNTMRNLRGAAIPVAVNALGPKILAVLAAGKTVN